MHRHSRAGAGAGSRMASVGAACLCTALVVGCGTDRDPGAVTTSSRPPVVSASTPTSPASTTAPTTASPGAPTSTTDSPGAGSPPATPTAAPTSAWPPFESAVEAVTAARLGPTWHPGCPVGPEDLRLVRLTHATPDGLSATGELIVAAAVADDVIAAFEEIYAARFPITRMTTIDAYGADDDASMAADNTSVFNCRPVTGGEGFSRHSYGLAIDINPLRNPYVKGDLVLPPAGQTYLDRTDVRPGMIVAGDVVVTAFTSRGFEWGGNFQSLKDYQHFDR